MVKLPMRPTLPCSPFIRLLMRAAAGALYRHARGGRESLRGSKKRRSAASGKDVCAGFKGFVYDPL
jgi:hypothetical protein